MKKLFHVFVVFAVLGSLTECRVVKDRRLDDRLDRDDPQAALYGPRGGLGGKGVAGKTKTKIIRADREGYMRASCEFLPANEWSMTTGNIEFKQKSGSPMEMYLNLFGLSSSVSQYNVQVFTSGAVMQGCQNAGVPYDIGRYNGLLAEVSSDVINNGEVQLAMLDVSATILGKKSIFGRSIQIIPTDSNEPAACCIVVHESMKDMFDNVETTKISPPIEIDGDNLDLDEEGWASLMEQIYTEAEKNGVDPQSITKLVSLSGAISQGSNTGIDMDALFAEAAKHGIDPQSITKVIEMGTGTVEESLGGEENMGSSVMDEVIKEAEKQGVDPNSITKIVEIDESELMAKGGENIDPSVRDAVIEGAVRQGIDPNTITKITEKGVDDLDASVRDAVYEEARKQGIDPSTITKIVDVEESTGDIEANGENLGAQGNVDSSLMDQVYEEARKQGVDPSTITEVIELTEDSEGHLVLPSGLADVQHKVDLDAVIKAAEKKGIDPSTISKIVELKGAADGTSMPDGSMVNANGMIASNRQSMLDAVYKAAQERNIPLDTITKVIDISEDPSETDVDAFQQAGINLVGKSKLSSEDFEVIKSAEGLESDIRVAIDGVIPTDGDNENTPAVLNEGEDDELPDAKPITDGVDQ